MDGSKDATKEEGEVDDATAPASMAHTTTWAGLACYFLGSILFIAGSLGFLLSTTTYAESWLGPFQFGAFCWILGSLSYMAQLLPAVAESLWSRDVDPKALANAARHPWWLGPMGSALCLLAFIAGCSIVFFRPGTLGVADQAQVVRNLPAMNGLFTAGSALLLVNPLYLLVASRQWHVLPCSPRRRGATASVIVAPVDWWFDIVVAATFTYAGAVGGYGTDQGEITSRMVLWLVGSLVLLVQALFILAVKLLVGGTDGEPTVNSTLAGETTKGMEGDCSV